MDAIFSAAVPVPRWFRWWFNAAAGVRRPQRPAQQLPRRVLVLKPALSKRERVKVDARRVPRKTASSRLRTRRGVNVTYANAYPGRRRAYSISVDVFPVPANALTIIVRGGRRRSRGCGFFPPPPPPPRARQLCGDDRALLSRQRAAAAVSVRFSAYASAISSCVSLARAASRFPLHDASHPAAAATRDVSSVTSSTASVDVPSSVVAVSRAASTAAANSVAIARESSRAREKRARERRPRVAASRADVAAAADVASADVAFAAAVAKASAAAAQPPRGDLLDRRGEPRRRRAAPNRLSPPRAPARRPARRLMMRVMISHTVDTTRRRGGVQRRVSRSREGGVDDDR